MIFSGLYTVLICFITPGIHQLRMKTIHLTLVPASSESWLITRLHQLLSLIDDGSVLLLVTKTTTIQNRTNYEKFNVNIIEISSGLCTKIITPKKLKLNVLKILMIK